MNQEKIGNFIKKIRKDNNLSQQAFAERLGVSFQAVSKWENGKNLPDISTLKEIKKQFNVNIDDIIEATDNKNKKSKLLIVTILLIIIVIGFILYFLINKNLNKDNFEFNEVNSTNSDFKVVGSVVITDNRTSLIINDVIYTGNDDNIIYDEISCKLYEEKDSKNVEVSSCESKKNSTLIDYLSDLKIRMDHYSSNCTMFIKSSMYIEIKAVNNKNKTISYKIPIEMSNNECK